MYDECLVSVVIPAYNEEGLVGNVIGELPRFVDWAFVVDDASTDGTWEEIRRSANAVNGSQDARAIADGGSAEGLRIVPIRHESNAGRGAAVKTGYRKAVECDADVIAVIDGDGQHDPGILDRFLDPIVTGRADYAKGNRLLSAQHRDRMSKWRLFGNAMLTFLTKVSSGYWRMMDSQNGYTVISADMLESLELDTLYDEYGFLNDILVKLNVAEARIVDIEMSARYGDEESGIRYSTFIPKVSSLLVRNFLWRLRTNYLFFDFHPLVGLYVLGGASVIGAGGVAVWSLNGDVTPWQVGLAVVLLLFSGLFLTLAMIFDRANNVHLERRRRDGTGGGVG